jgi:hypothetical protein
MRRAPAGVRVWAEAGGMVAQGTGRPLGEAGGGLGSSRCVTSRQKTAAAARSRCTLSAEPVATVHGTVGPVIRSERGGAMRTPYRPRCYEPDGCADIIDARRLGVKFPRRFPRFVQHAIWQFCAEEGLDQCNGRQIDDSERCDRKKRHLHQRCDRVVPNEKRSRKDA